MFRSNGSTKIHQATKNPRNRLKNRLVQRAGFEPANPYGKGCLKGAISGQQTDLESFTFDLAWLPLPRVQTSDSFLLIVSRVFGRSRPVSLDKLLGKFICVLLGSLVFYVEVCSQMMVEFMQNDERILQDFAV
jgi:hypothetical protein